MGAATIKLIESIQCWQKNNVKYEQKETPHTMMWISKKIPFESF